MYAACLQKFCCSWNECVPVNIHWGVPDFKKCKLSVHVYYIYIDVYSFLYTHVLSHCSCPEYGCLFSYKTNTHLPVDCFPLEHNPKYLDTTHCGDSEFPHHSVFSVRPNKIATFFRLQCEFVTRNFYEKLRHLNWEIWPCGSPAALDGTRMLAADSWKTVARQSAIAISGVVVGSLQRFVDCREREENCADLQPSKQEDNLIRYIVYRHVSTIRITYILQYLWRMLCVLL